MATKKIKRFQEGGMSDKDRGLEASKDEKVGFFERLRMGNIDDEGSEAYRRFGAGRGRNNFETTPAREPAQYRADPYGEMTQAERDARPSSEEIQAKKRGVEQGKLQPSGDASVAEMYSGPRTKPIVTDQPKSGGKKNVDVQASKPSAPVKSAPAKTSAYPMMGAQPTTKTYERSGGPTADELANYKPPARNQTLASQIPGESNTRPVAGEKVEPMSDTERNINKLLVGTGAGAGVAGAFYKGKKMLDARKAAKIGAQKRANLKRDVEEGIDRNLADEVKSYSQSAAEKAVAAKQGAEKTKADRSRDLNAGQAKTKFTSASKTSPKKTKKFDDESNIEFKRGGKAYAAGGSVSGASKRADGIAIKGKTRCKMR
jgi:hypothetical protein